MAEVETAQVKLIPAHAGRKRNNAALQPDAIVRVEIRMPASTAARLYERAHDLGQPVSKTAAELIVAALDTTGGGEAA